MNKLFYTLALLCFSVTSVNAQYINLTADKQVEWDSKAQKMTAIGNAIASKDGMDIRADKMTAYYAKNTSPNANNKTTVNEVHAEGGVVMTSDTTKAYGDTMDYDVAKDTIVLRGAPAQIKTDKEFITAKDTITYYPSQEKAIALGDVYAQDQKKNKIYSDKMIAFFKKTADKGSLDMDKVEIYGKVKIVTPSANVTADKGIYLPKTGMVKLFSNVIISQNGNHMKGDFAETNLNTGISKLIAGKTSQGRVSGIFKEKKKTDDNKKISKPTAENKQE